MKGVSKSLAILLALAAGAAPAQAAPDPLRIGVPTSRTGALAVLGDQVVRAIEFAAERANAAGGVDGHKVEVRVADDEGNPDAGRRAGEKLSLEGYRILIGTISSAVGLALSTQLNRWDAIYVSVVNKSPKITGDSCSRRMFRANHSDDMDFAIVAPWLKDQKEQTWAIIAADYLWGRGSGSAFKTTAERLGRTVKLELFPPLGTTDYAPYITQLRDSGAQGLWVALAGSDAINFAKQAKQFGLTDKVVMFGHNFVTPSSIKAVGKDAIGIWGNLGYAPDIPTPVNADFVAAWRAKFQTDPTDYEGEAYAGMQAIFSAVTKAKSVAPLEVAKALEGLTVSTVFGDVTMRAADHQMELPNYIGRVSETDGKVAIKTLLTFDAATATPPPSPACKL
ncbi:ABC transporter substrate-binding protein [Xanthobacter dioxanivorans]|uniref:ABC transporter substrate-binding protein n=1 Tax=Xanthobacter dioxanivorans TaxID=2528964 RepID=A0A974PT31_9HYPH|nr:ABC transporter substrate-binding protein [Xanthobacter dioxanivorans]QRG09031.1 ABC transporter substrate-binding protein [Xanthobacter dioxanivorans]